MSNTFGREITKEELVVALDLMCESTASSIEVASHNGVNDGEFDVTQELLNLIGENKEKVLKFLLGLHFEKEDCAAWPEAQVFYDCRDLALEEVRDFVADDKEWEDCEEVVLGTIHNAQVAWVEFQEAMNR